MAKSVFHSFHFKRDSHRVSHVRNMGVIEGQPVLSSNEWEDVKKGGACTCAVPSRHLGDGRDRRRHHCHG